MTKKEIEYLKFSLNRDVPISPDCIKEIVLQLIDENETMKAKLNGVDNEPLNVDCTLCQHFNTQKCDDLCVRYSLYENLKKPEKWKHMED